MESRENQTKRGGDPEETLRERAGMLESILNGVLLLITYTDKEERYAFVNRAGARPSRSI